MHMREQQGKLKNVKRMQKIVGLQICDYFTLYLLLH